MQNPKAGSSRGPDAPSIIGTSNKAGTTRPIAGSGDHVYEVIHDWGELPPEIRYGNTHGVCEDSQGRIYIHHTVNKDSQSHNAMVVFDADGKFIELGFRVHGRRARPPHTEGGSRRISLSL